MWKFLKGLTNSTLKKNKKCIIKSNKYIKKNLRDISAIRMDVLSFNALGYKELIGIDKVEDLMAGPSIDNTFYYKNIKNFDIVKDRIEDIKEEDFNNLESFLNTITIKNNNKQMVLSK